MARDIWIDRVIWPTFRRGYYLFLALAFWNRIVSPSFFSFFFFLTSCRLEVFLAPLLFYRHLY